MDPAQWLKAPFDSACADLEGKGSLRKKGNTMVTVTFEIYTADFVLFAEASVERKNLAATLANLRAMPNVRNISY